MFYEFVIFNFLILYFCPNLIIFGFTSRGNGPNIVGERNLSRRSMDLNLPIPEFVQKQIHTHVYLQSILPLRYLCCELLCVELDNFALL